VHELRRPLGSRSKRCVGRSPNWRQNVEDVLPQPRGREDGPVVGRDLGAERAHRAVVADGRADHQPRNVILEHEPLVD
jgi:hypothetical protein